MPLATPAAPPVCPLEGNTQRKRLIDLGEFIGPLAAVIETQARAGAEIRADTLLEIERKAGPGAILSHQRGIGNRARQLTEADSVRIGAHAAAIDETQQLQLAGSAEQHVALFDLRDELELVEVG